MLCNNANARRCSYFELGLPVVSLINSYFRYPPRKCASTTKASNLMKNKQTNKQTEQTKKQTNINPKPSFTHQNYNSAVYMFIIC